MDPLPRYALAARAAYYPVAQSQADFAVAGLMFVDEYRTPDGDFRALAILDGPDLVLAFRGTDNAENWLTDARCAPAKYKPLRFSIAVDVHAGFLSAWLALRPWATDVSTRYPEARRIVLVGHSLGGAIATLAATDLWALAQVPLVCYSYGCPKVAFASFRDLYQRAVSVTVRVVHDLDVVPTQPLLIGYTHVCDEIRLGDDGRAITPVRGFFSRLWSWDRQAAADLFGKAEDEHRVSRYVACCTAYAARFAATQPSLTIGV